MITVINALTFTTGSVLGILIGYFIEHQLARSRSIEAIRIVEFNKAAAAFYVSFLDDVYLLNHTDPKRISIALLERAEVNKRLERENIDMVHEKAKIMFEPFIAKSDLAGFNAAWSAYHNWPQHYAKNISEGKEYDFRRAKGT